MRNQLVKNLVFMINTLLDLKEKCDISQLYKKMSYIGRRMMLDIKTS